MKFLTAIFCALILLCGCSRQPTDAKILAMEKRLDVLEADGVTNGVRLYRLAELAGSNEEAHIIMIAHITNLVAAVRELQRAQMSLAKTVQSNAAVR